MCNLCLIVVVRTASIAEIIQRCVLIILDSETVSLTGSENRYGIREQEAREKNGFHFCVFTAETNRSSRFSELCISACSTRLHTANYTAVISSLP